MFKKSWSFIAENFGFLVTRGVISSLVIGFFAAASFYHFLNEGDDLSPLVIGELAVIGIIVFGATAFVGYYTFGDNWPSMRIGTYWDEIHHQQDRAAKPSSRAHNKPIVNEINDFLAQERRKADATKNKN